jgi:hypothetical protein
MIDLTLSIVVDDHDQTVTTDRFDLELSADTGQVRFTDC